MSDSIPALVMQLLDVFEGPLRDVHFPDADGTVLVAAANDVRAAHAAVAKAEASLESARALLAETQSLLRQRAERALAYARVYAEDRAELRAQLDELIPAKRGPGRPPSARTAPAMSPATTATASDGLAADRVEPRGRRRRSVEPLVEESVVEAAE